MRRVLLLLLPALGALAACGGNVIADGAGTTGTGASTTANTCTSTALTCEVNAGLPGHVCETICGPLGMTPCPSGSTTLSSCPTAGALGTCFFSTMTSVVESLSVVYYSDGGFTAEQAKTSCEALTGAVWTPAS